MMIAIVLFSLITKSCGNIRATPVLINHLNVVSVEKVCETLRSRVKSLDQLGKVILEELEIEDSALRFAMLKAEQHNRWFTQDSIRQSIEAICQQFLRADKLEEFLQQYKVEETTAPRKVGLVLAGNLPMVGFHDVLCCLLGLHIPMIKLSSKDKFLIPYFLQKLSSIDPQLENSFELAERLAGFDAVIATGNNNSGRYFEFYFGKYPNIIRKNRSSLAVLDGSESDEEIQGLAHDCFDYFGLGCRSVSKLYFPKDFNIPDFLDKLESWKPLMEHHKYKNNYDYNRAILLLNETPHFASDFLMLQEGEAISSPVSVIYYEFYDSTSELENQLVNREEEIQCVVFKQTFENLKTVLPGHAQKPALSDFADGVDTMKFLLSLSESSAATTKPVK